MFNALSQLRRLLRLPALALLLLAVLINPVLASVGDLHEAARGVAGHLHDTQEHTLAQDAAHDADGNGSGLMHALIHAAHCCGHLNAILATFILHLAAPHQALAPRFRIMPSISAYIPADIRPPISH